MTAGAGVDRMKRCPDPRGEGTKRGRTILIQARIILVLKVPLV